MANEISIYKSSELAWSVSTEAITTDETFDSPAHILVLRHGGPNGAELLRLPIRSNFLDARELALAIDGLRTAIEATRYDGVPPRRLQLVQDLATIARGGIVRHGWATMQINNQNWATPFVADRGSYLIFGDGEPRPSAAAIEDEIGRTQPFRNQHALLNSKRKDVSVHMGEDVLGGKHKGDGWLFEHLWSPLANLGSVLNPFMHHCRGLRDLKDILNEDAGADCIKELRIHSHGNQHVIRMGDDDIIDQAEATRRQNAGDASAKPSFGTSGAPAAGSDLERVIDTLKKTMCKPAKIIFDACNAASGTLLKDLSRNLGPDITVNGFAGTGNPFTDGDTNFRNGVNVP